MSDWRGVNVRAGEVFLHWDLRYGFGLLCTWASPSETFLLWVFLCASIVQYYLLRNHGPLPEMNNLPSG